MGAGLVCQGVGDDVAFDEAFEESDCVSAPSDGGRGFLCFEFEGAVNGGVEVIDEFVEVVIVEAAFES